MYVIVDNLTDMVEGSVHMGVSSSQANNQAGSHFRSEQSTLGQPLDNGAEYTHSVSSEQQKEPGSSVVSNESGDTFTKIISEKTEAHNSECFQDEASQKNIQMSFHAVQNKPGEGSCALISGHVADQNRPFSEHSTLPHFKSPGNASESGSRNLCKLLEGELSEQDHPPKSDMIQNNENMLPGPKDRDEKICKVDLHQNLKDARSNFQRNELEPSLCREVVHPKPVEAGTPISRCTTTEPLGELGKSTPILCSSLKEATDNPTIESSLPLPEEITKDSSLETSAKPTKYSIKHSARRVVGKNLKTSKKNLMLRSSDRVLRSRSQEKPKAADLSNGVADASSNGESKRCKAADVSTSVADASSNGESKRRSKAADISSSVADASSNGESKRSKKMSQRNVADEYSKIIRHLRYLLNRINYEQSLITAYSTEGWKGLSLEKLKPEKELQRATSEILRRKLKIRDLFQNIDSLCAEGRLPESLFDSEGEIDSEDIFCAKCGSKDLPLDNDIILCDGACDRGFHQHCLDPPLLKEDIPPDDEGWLCPACDCKVDCIDMLNDSLETNISLSDGWERVFPEVAATGHSQDPNFGLPSDDSDDNDYNPDGPEPDEKKSGGESSSDGSSSDGSDFTSASEEFETPQNEEQNLGLPSDDSEDDNYDPDAPDDEMVNQESSSSDFTSDSEDLTATLKDNMSSQQDEDLTSAVSKEKKSKTGRKKGSLNDELSSIMESTPEQNGSAPVSKTRGIERLDYKKLYDEAYGNVNSSSSDDEDWSDATGSKKRKKSSGRAASATRNRDASDNAKVSDGIKQPSEEAEHTPSTRQKSNSRKKTESPARLLGDPMGSGSKRASSSAPKKLEEDQKQKLYESFKKNQYPDRAAKEIMAAELGLTFKQVNKWFGNTRWSFNHPSGKADTPVGKADTPASKADTPASKADTPAGKADTPASKADTPAGKADTPAGKAVTKSKTSGSRKRRKQ